MPVSRQAFQNSSCDGKVSGIVLKLWFFREFSPYPHLLTPLGRFEKRYRLIFILSRRGGEIWIRLLCIMRRRNMNKIIMYKVSLFQSFQNQTIGMTAILTSGEAPGHHHLDLRDHHQHNHHWVFTMVIMFTGEYKEECGTCALIAEGSTMPYSDNTCPQVTHTHNNTCTHNWHSSLERTPPSSHNKRNKHIS